MKLAPTIFFFVATIGALAKESPIDGHPQRELIHQNLQLLVDDRAKEEENHFFACRLSGRDWIFWREGRLLMPTTFEVAVGDSDISAEQIWALRIRYCRKPIELDAGVVARKEDIPPATTFLVSRDVVAGIVYDCVLNGEMVVVKKKPNQSLATAPSGRGSP